MSDHELVWTFERDTVHVRAQCNAAPDATCRLTSDCDCEAVTYEHDERGHFHWGYDSESDDEVRHDMWLGTDCNICLFLNEDPFMLAELSEGSPSFEIGRTPIRPVWRYDYYQWKPVQA